MIQSAFTACIFQKKPDIQAERLTVMTVKQNGLWSILSPDVWGIKATAP